MRVGRDTDRVNEIGGFDGQTWHELGLSLLRGQVISEARHHHALADLDVEGEATGEDLRLGWEAIVCTNNDCRKLSLYVRLATRHSDAQARFYYNTLNSWVLLPPSTAKPQPNYIPKAIRDDYYEACAIRDLSPKASATITRRCLQGMIRDFCGISKKRLIDEINALKVLVHNGQAPAGVPPTRSLRLIRSGRSGTSAPTWKPTSTLLSTSIPMKLKYLLTWSSYFSPSGTSQSMIGQSGSLRSN